MNGAPIPNQMSNNNMNMNNQNNQNIQNRNYYNNNNYYRPRTFQYPNYNPNAFRNNLVNKNINYQPNNMTNVKQNPNQNSTSPKIDLKEFLMKSFLSINEDFLILTPVFIPIIPGDDPEDKFNDEEHL